MNCGAETLPRYEERSAASSYLPEAFATESLRRGTGAFYPKRSLTPLPLGGSAVITEEGDKRW